MLLTNLVQAITWAFAFKKRKIENEASEADAVDSIRELTKKVADDLKERYVEQSKRIDDLVTKERDALRERSILEGKITILTAQDVENKRIIQSLNKEVSAWKGKFEGLKREFDEYKKQFQHEK